MSMVSHQLAVILSGLPLAACMATPAVVLPAAGTPIAAETITLSVGPCFGFCPVYTASISPVGSVRFDGKRHTAVLGEKTRQVEAETYRNIARQLAPFRPANGDEIAIACSAAVSDTSMFTVTWMDAGGRNASATIATGCSAGPGRSLVEILSAVPGELGVADWARQITRAGTPRG